MEARCDRQRAGWFGLEGSEQSAGTGGARGARRGVFVIETLERLETPPEEQAEKVRRLFDGRPDDERVDWEHEWHPTGGPWLELDADDTAGQRRAWYARLVELGEIEAKP